MLKKAEGEREKNACTAVFSTSFRKEKKKKIQAKRSRRPFGKVIKLYIYFSTSISLTNAVLPGAEELKGSMKHKLVNMWISGTGDKSALIRLQKHNPG